LYPEKATASEFSVGQTISLKIFSEKQFQRLQEGTFYQSKDELAKVEMKKTACVLGDARRRRTYRLLSSKLCGWIGQTGDSLMYLEDQKTVDGVYNERLKTGPRIAST